MESGRILVLHLVVVFVPCEDSGQFKSAVRQRPYFVVVDFASVHIMLVIAVFYGQSDKGFSAVLVENWMEDWFRPADVFAFDVELF